MCPDGDGHFPWPLTVTSELWAGRYGGLTDLLLPTSRVLQPCVEPDLGLVSSAVGPSVASALGTSVEMRAKEKGQQEDVMAVLGPVLQTLCSECSL